MAQNASQQDTFNLFRLKSQGTVTTTARSLCLTILQSMKARGHDIPFPVSASADLLPDREKLHRSLHPSVDRADHLLMVLHKENSKRLN